MLARIWKGVQRSVQLESYSVEMVVERVKTMVITSPSFDKSCFKKSPVRPFSATVSLETHFSYLWEYHWVEKRRARYLEYERS